MKTQSFVVSGKTKKNSWYFMFHRSALSVAPRNGYSAQRWSIVLEPLVNNYTEGLLSPQDGCRRDRGRLGREGDEQRQRKDRKTERKKTKKKESDLGGSQNKGDCVGRVEWDGGGSEQLNFKTVVSRHDIEYILHKEGPENMLGADSCLVLWQAVESKNWTYPIDGI